MTVTIEKGCDISWWQGIVNFLKMKLAGVLFVIIRAGSCNSVTGDCYWDYCVATNAEGAEEVSLRKGFYWFYREFGIEHAKKQARFFWDAIKEWTIEEGLFCDVEVYNANLKNVFAFMLELKRVSGLPDKMLGIYSRALLWNALSGDHSLFKRFLCWVARYCVLLHPWNDAVHMRMQPWDEPDYHQHSADGNGRGAEYGVESDDIDLNRKFIVGDDSNEEPENPLKPAHVLIIPTGNVLVEIQAEVV